MARMPPVPDRADLDQPRPSAISAACPRHAAVVLRPRRAGPLDGILAVSVEQAVAAPFCSSRLADAGARIIKVERPEGDFARYYDRAVNGDSAYFVWLNRGKESVVLDIKNPDDAALLRVMLARADVYIQNLAPGAAERAGLGSAAMRRANPRLVTCDISGYGEDGPYRDMKAYDLLVQAETGLCSVTGTPEAPGRVGVSVCDIAAGLNAPRRHRSGAVCARAHRRRIGRESVAVRRHGGLDDRAVAPPAPYRRARRRAPGCGIPPSRPTAPMPRQTEDRC